MPTIPTRPADIPAVLNPFNLRHYWLLLKWVFFQPSKLKLYCYWTSPDIYLGTETGGWWQRLRQPAIRNLYAMSSLLALVITFSMAISIAMVQDTTVRWIDLTIGVAIGIAVGMAFGMSFGVVTGVMFGVGVSVAAGVTFAMAFGVALGVGLGVASPFVFGTIFGLMGGIAMGVLGGVSGVIAFGVGSGILTGMISAVGSGLIGGLVGFCGGSRILFLAFEWPQAWLWRGNKLSNFETHPLLWDELAVLPLPKASRLLRASLTKDLERGLVIAAQVAANPFQRWVVQRSLTDFIHSHPNPLLIIYRLAHHPALDEYLFFPSVRWQLRMEINQRLLLLGELGQLFVDCSAGRNETLERWVWRLTSLGRRMKSTPLSNFSLVLLVLFIKESTLDKTDQLEDLKELNDMLEKIPTICYPIRDFPHGTEVAESFASLVVFLQISNMSSLGAAVNHIEWLAALNEPPLRPPVIEALKALGDVSRMVASYQASTSFRQKTTALNRAAGSLNELAGYVQDQVLPPERALLARIVRQWQAIIAGEQGKLGEDTLRDLAHGARRSVDLPALQSVVWTRPAAQLDNPYIVGNPVDPPLFVGRKDIFDRISEVWSAKETPDSIILFGHRRMGKSSILRNLAQVAPAGSLIVYADMAGETSFVASTADLLLGLADRIHAAIALFDPQISLHRPDPNDYATPSRAQIQFNRLLDDVRSILGNHTIIMALDEFEAVERAVQAGKISPEIYAFLRAKTHERHLTLVFGGLHTLDEMTRDYRQPFYGSYSNLLVSYLSQAAAWQLVTNPTPDFDLNYEPAAVERIITETGGQPYLVQQVCRDAIDHLNSELFDERLKREICITLADVDAVLVPDFFRRGTGYFDGVWTQVDNSVRRAVLTVMAQSETPWEFAHLKSATSVDDATLQAALDWAVRHDILYCQSDPAIWGFHVPLMRRWICECAPRVS